ncbi:MAG: AGE family epimerase/isomerase [Marinilabiliaceae bacterium]|jgi:mannobiose 2-epimerase|nr:AGE family epimerase/isomerase [Marinilabiliaceae bacterium]
MKMNVEHHKELEKYRRAFEDELFNILQYWMHYSIEEDSSGFYGAVDLSNMPVRTANKSCVLNARILWTFAAAAKAYPGKAYKDIAHLAYKVVTEDFADMEEGGFYMELSSENEVVNDIKHTYAQAFVLYSFSKYYEFSPSGALLQKIKDLFSFLDSKTKDPENIGYLESFTRCWKFYEENRMADNNEPKSMNTHLHILEAYAAVYKVWKGELVKKRLTELLMIFINNIIRESGHLGVFFSSDFQETKSSKEVCSFGHDIEASWLIWEAAKTLGNQEILEQVKPLITKMADAVLRVAVDKDGGLFLESTRFGSHVRTNKHWWLQAETLVGFMNMFQLQGDPKYWETVKLSWDFIRRYVIDHQGGEWFAKVNRLGVPYLLEPPDDPSPYYRNDWKVDPWKCPYHNGRAMLEMVERIDTIIINKK